MTSDRQGDRARFDPYYKWLGIPRKDQPPDHYRLLGISRFETDAEVIQNAADQRTAVLQGFLAGEHADLARKLFSQVAAARVVLLSPRKKDVYDQSLRRTQAASQTVPAQPGASPSGSAVPPPSFSLGAIGISASQSISGKPAKGSPRTDRQSGVPAWMWGIGGLTAMLLGGVVVFLVAQGGRTPSDPSLAQKSAAKDSPQKGPAIADAAAAAGGKRPGSPSEKDRNLDAEKSAGARKMPDAAPRLTPRPDAAAAPRDGDQGQSPFFQPRSADEQDFGSGPASGAPPQAANPSDDPRFRIAAPATRVALPGEAAQESARAKVNEIYQNEIAGARTAAKKQALAVKLYEQAQKFGDDAAGRYVLFCAAADLAKDADQCVLAWHILDDIERYFVTDVLPRKEACLKAVMPQAKTPGDFRILAEAWRVLLNQAVKQDDYDTALRYAEEVARCASKAGDKTLQKRVAEGAKQLREMRSASAEAQKAKAALARDANDAEAAWIWGRFLCLYRNEWLTGLPFWAKGGDREGVAPARQDLAAAFDTEGRIKTGDAWWDLAEDEPALRPRQLLRERAAYWYGLALPQAKGFTKIRIEKRIQETVSPSEGKGSPPEKRQPPPSRSRGEPRKPANP